QCSKSRQPDVWCRQKKSASDLLQFLVDIRVLWPQLFSVGFIEEEAPAGSRVWLL
ncbi:hypothetical protein ElyMa_005199300, partial [Elysia marginata]